MWDFRAMYRKKKLLAIQVGPTKIKKFETYVPYLWCREMQICAGIGPDHLNDLSLSVFLPTDIRWQRASGKRLSCSTPTIQSDPGTYG